MVAVYVVWKSSLFIYNISQVDFYTTVPDVLFTQQIPVEAYTFSHFDISNTVFSITTTIAAATTVLQLLKISLLLLLILV